MKAISVRQPWAWLLFNGVLAIQAALVWLRG